MKDIIEGMYYVIPGFMNYYLYKINGLYYVVSSKSFKKYPNGYWLKADRAPGKPRETKFKMSEDTGDYKVLMVSEIIDLVHSVELVIKYPYVPAIVRRRRDRALRATEKGSVVKEKTRSSNTVLPNFSGLVREERIVPFTFE